MSESESECYSDNEDIYKCEDCNQVFKSNKALMIHFKRALVHSGNSSSFECHACNKKFPIFSRLNRHLLTCKKNKTNKYEAVQKALDEANEKLKEEIENKTKALDEANEKLKEEIESKKSAIQELEVTKGKLQVLDNLKVVNNFVNVNAVINVQNVVQRLPMVRDSDIEGLIQNAPYESFHSADSLGSYLSRNYLKERLVTTDYSRGVVAWKDENRNLIKDKGALQISKKISKIGSKNRLDINRKLKEFDEQMDQTNSAHIININAKYDTYQKIISQNTDFNIDLGKSVAKESPQLSSFQSLPEQKFENFKNSVQQFFKAYGSPLVRHNCSTFINHFVENFGLIKPNAYDDICFYILENFVRKGDIKFFLVSKSVYFSDDSENLYHDRKCEQLCGMVLAFLKDNILKNAEGNNKAGYFKFSDDDIRLLCDKDKFLQFFIDILREYF